MTRSSSTMHQQHMDANSVHGSCALMAAVLLVLLSVSSLATFSHCTSLTAPASDGDYDDYLCVYTVYIRTGAVWKGGTDSVISLALAGANRRGVAIRDLVSWGGLMCPDSDYFERGNLDIFSGRGPCLTSTPCWMNLTSDGSGEHPGWYCSYVEVTVTGPHMGCGQRKFTVEQWLARDVAPYKLYATRNLCHLRDGDGGGGGGEGEIQLRQVGRS